MSDGIGCVCAAHSENECCCGADWRPKELIDLRQQLASRNAEVERYASALLHVRKALCGDIHNTEDILDLVESLNKECDQLREQVKVARSYFEAIIDPIAYMRAKLEDGYELNGSMAVQLSQSHTYLKGVAKEALAATELKL